MRSAWWLFALALLVNLMLRWYWMSAAQLGTQGDEGHFLMMARSLWEDHDLDLRADYANPQRVVKIFGQKVIDSHCRPQGEACYSVHYPGIPAVIAVPYEIFGTAGARVVMCMIGSILVVLFFQILNRHLQDRQWALVFACFFYFGLLYVPASNQIYQDLPAGIAILAVADVCMRYFKKIPVATGTFATAVLLIAALPWLHAKHLLPAAILSGTLAWQCYRRESVYARRVGFATAIIGLSVAGLLAYNLHCFGSILGPADSSLPHAASTAMIYAGLHLDQAQGLFFQQPLFLLGVLGLAALWREDRKMLLWLIVLYHSILVPNAMHPNLYGGYSFAGRYLWSCSPLWIYPAASFLAFLGATAPGMLKPILASAACYQAVLASRWLSHPVRMLSTVSGILVSRNTLFGDKVRYALPSFYDPKLFASEAANLLAVVGVFALAIAGGLLLQKKYGPVKALVWGYLMAAAIFSPGVPSGEYERDAQDAFLRKAAQWAQDKSFEVEKLFSPADGTVAVVKDPEASGGFARHVAADAQKGGSEAFFFYGPYTTLAPGSYAADFRLRADDVQAKERVAVLDVFSGSAGPLATLEIKGTDLRVAGAYQVFRLTFRLDRVVTDLETRCRHYNRTGLTADRVDIMYLSP